MQQSAEQRIVVMTGATGGFGAYAAKCLAAQPATHLYIGARGVDRPAPDGTKVLPLDLASLSLVRQFVDNLLSELDGSRIDVLVLNAGTHLTDTDRISDEGFELTFAVNHLSHYLLARLLLPFMAEGGRIVITTSDTHDPSMTRMAPLSLDPKTLSIPAKRGFGSGMRAYAASKLCNLMTALSLSAQKEIKARKISVLAFNPGLTSGSAGRDSPPAVRAVMALLMSTVFRVVGLFRPHFIANRPEHSGQALADVALGNIKLPADQIYVSLVQGKVTFPSPSELALNQDAQDQLWRVSASMVGINEGK